MMNHPASVTQESGSVLEFGSQLAFFGFNKTLNTVNSDGCSSFKSNYLYFNYSVGSKRRRVSASLSLSSTCGSSIKSIWSEFNRVIKFHCERIPIGFASVRVNSSDSSGLSDNGNAFPVEEGLPLNCAEGENPKRVLILMSDTGGGHRASAEAIKAAFNEEFGDRYQVSFDRFHVK
ncbi:monogalactosyldiacylglycerol synthase 1 chloroplastic-like isoform X3 [Tripterygium wilfordii]|uniref:Monogalactosyldiacylglycerol synthase 1 chloroplastic-like isoform X3 n=1 Tax=Tripterygium wilfordii TaxID=458696 RepID=A0A7J7BX73_TRIWF|nr:monogalactosyldiacylglycerol synthase 1 chloroplastic-like isoform X3 [Tripterygium wilfordii]